jgi:hypothetical protein
MGRLLAGWRALSWHERRQLFVCIFGLAIIHGSLALLGYARTRGIVEALTVRKAPRAAQVVEVMAAQALARLAAIAGRKGAVEATCLRQALLLLGWLRVQGFNPVFHLGIKAFSEPPQAFQAHAWIELEGTPLLPLDAGHRSFFTPPTSA